MIRELETAPAGMPITKEQVKTLANINNVNQDTEIDILIEAAVSWAEKYTGRVFVNQTWNIYYDLPEGANKMNLDTLNVNSIVSVSTFARDNTETVMDSADYRFFGDCFILNETASFSSLSLRNFQAIKIQVIAGYGVDSTDQPNDIEAALSQLVSYWIRTAQVTRSKGKYNNIPLGTESKLMKYIKKIQWM
jgi:uncharacterized phiE125 gp8 family phage protein